MSQLQATLWTSMLSWIINYYHRFPQNSDIDSLLNLQEACQSLFL